MGARESLELPASRRPRVALVLLFDAILLACGLFLILRHHRRAVAEAVAAPAPAIVKPAVIPAVEPAPPVVVPAVNPPKTPETGTGTKPPETSTGTKPPETSTSTSTRAGTKETGTAEKTAPRPPPTRLPDKPPALPDPGKPVIVKPAATPDAAPVAAAPPPDAAAPEPPTDVVDTPPPEAPPPDAAPPEPSHDREWGEAMTRGIRQVVEDHRDSIEDCYRRASKSSTTAEPLQGRLDIHLRIVPSGDADDVRVVDNRTGSEELGACLVALMESWKYPAPGRESMDFVWPFTFQGR